jgi:16S rRNA (adenine1518-N6/adenine1519-N6)-dimethyltransferase
LEALNNFISASEIRELAKKLALTPSKKLGQNFVMDPNSIEKIVRLSKVDQNDVVIEVGPGLGSLTVGLLPRVKQLYAIELDKRLADQLTETIESKISSENLEVINKDFLELELADLRIEPTALVANLPYNLSVPILLQALLKLPSINNFLIMVQSEVAARICAAPASRIYGIPSVKIQYLAEAKIVSEISRKVFWPEPNVDSSLVRLTRKTNFDASLQVLLFKLVDAAFSQRRKMLRSTLKQLRLTEIELNELFQKSEIDPKKRAEQLSVDDYQNMAKQLALILGSS